MFVLQVPFRTQAFDRGVNMFTQVKFVDRVFDVLQNLRLFSKLLGPIGIEVEAERVKMRMNITTTARLSAPSLELRTL